MKIQKNMVGPRRFELRTSALSERRNNQSMPRARYVRRRGAQLNWIKALRIRTIF